MDDEEEWAKILAAAQDFDEDRERELARTGRARERAKPPPVRKSAKEKAAEARKAGLEKKIDTYNVGYRLMSKMGYKEGMRLGGVNKGIAEPLKPILKADTKGVGREEADKEEFLRLAQLGRERERRSREEYISSTVAKQSVRSLQKDVAELRESLSAVSLRHAMCIVKLEYRSYLQELNEWLQTPENQWMDMPPLKWNFDKGFTGPTNRRLYNCELILTLGEKQKLQHLVTSFKSRGVGTSKKRAKQDCAFKLLQQLHDAKVKKVDPKQLERLDKRKPLPHAGKLQNELRFLVDRMRTKYAYCPYCDAQFPSLKALESNCPGETKGAHPHLINEDDFNDEL